MKLLLFNPETEYALASGASFYTPPARVEKMRREMQLLPEAWASHDDYILVDCPDSLHSAFNLVSWQGVSALIEKFPEVHIEPWGWNAALVRRFLDLGVPACYLPDAAAIALIRELAHRRTTIRLNSRWNEVMDSKFAVDVPVELFSTDECMDFYRSHTGCWMKAPWSSSGRGVINTAADMADFMVQQWCRGILRRQGSVMGETGARRIADFATEWHIHSGIPEFIGLSSFSTSNRGKYISNESLGQGELMARFDSLSLIPIKEVIAMQKDILHDVMQGYEGLCGVDMLVESDGHIRPFVELNVRRTMGMLNWKDSCRHEALED